MHIKQLLFVKITWNYIKSKVGDPCREWPEGSFSIVTIPRCRGALFLPLDCSTLPYNVGCEARRCQVLFLSISYDLTWDWTPFSWTIGGHYPLGQTVWKIVTNKQFFINGMYLTLSLSPSLSLSLSLSHTQTQSYIYIYIYIYSSKFC